MIINAIHVYSSGVKYAELSLDRTDLSQSYIIQSATGLDIDEIINQFYGIGLDARPKFFDMTPKQRTIVMRINLNPQYSLNQTPSSLRESLYRAISSDRTSTVELRFMNDTTTVANVFGFVTKFEANIFSASPAVQLTIKCDYPFFRSPSRIAVATGGLSKSTPVIVDNVSTAPHGFRFQLTFTSNVTNLAINKTGDTEWLFSITYAFLTGDVLYFSSEDDNKYLYRIRSGVTLHLANLLNAGAVWPLLFPGSNSFSFSSSAFDWNDVSYYQTYWGV